MRLLESAGRMLPRPGSGHPGASHSGDQPPVTLVALRAVVLSQVMIVAIDAYDGEILGLVVAIWGCGASWMSSCGLCGDRVVPVLLFEDLRAALPTVGR